MSELLLPDHIAKANRAKEEIKKNEQSAKQIPIPTGYNVLLMMPQAEETFDSGIVKADTTKHIEEIANVVAFVLDMGPDAYKDKEVFPSGPYCKKGDFVLLQAYSGVRFKIHGQEFRMVVDKSILGVIEDPRGYGRV